VVAAAAAVVVVVGAKGGELPYARLCTTELSLYNRLQFFLCLTRILCHFYDFMLNFLLCA
jgi:hypothetical protein